MYTGSMVSNFGQSGGESTSNRQPEELPHKSSSAESADEEHVIFFTAGNPEVHRLLRTAGRSDEMIYEDVSAAFRVDCILGDLVLQSSSNYYESDITRRLGHDYQLLFDRGIAEFVIRKDHGDFVTDREAARTTYPNTAEYKGYFGHEGDRRLQELRNFGFVHYRIGRMAGAIDTLWHRGLAGIINDDIVTRIQNVTSLTVPERDTLLYTLRSLPVERGGAPFIWEVIETGLRHGGLRIPRALGRELRQYLLRTYFRAASVLYQPATVVSNPSRYLERVLAEPSVNRYNTELFLAFCNSLGIRSIVERLTPQQILELRDSLEFAPFRRAYFKLIDEAKTLEDAKIALLAKVLGEQFDRTLFRTQSFVELDQAVRLGLGKVRPQTTSNERLRRIIADPESGAFWVLRESVLARYSTAIDSVAATHQDGISDGLTSGLTIKNKIEVIMGNKTVGDNYQVGQAAVVGPHGHAHDIVLNQWQQVKDSVDLETLASQLALLRQSLQPLVSSADEAVELGAVAQAENEAKAGNGAGALAALAKVGKWALGTAEKIGVGMAIFAIKHACGL